MTNKVAQTYASHCKYIHIRRDMLTVRLNVCKSKINLSKLAQLII